MKAEGMIKSPGAVRRRRRKRRRSACTNTEKLEYCCAEQKRKAKRRWDGYVILCLTGFCNRLLKSTVFRPLIIFPD